MGLNLIHCGVANLCTKKPLDLNIHVIWMHVILVFGFAQYILSAQLCNTFLSVSGFISLMFCSKFFFGVRVVNSSLEPESFYLSCIVLFLQRESIIIGSVPIANLHFCTYWWSLRFPKTNTKWIQLATSNQSRCYCQMLSEMCNSKAIIVHVLHYIHPHAVFASFSVPISMKDVTIPKSSVECCC